MLKTLDYTIRIGSTPTILYLDLYFNTSCAGHNVYFNWKNVDQTLRHVM